MKAISDMAENMPPSSIRKMFDLAEKMEDTVSFAVGEPGSDTESFIVEAADKAAREGKTRYVANAGIIELRKVIADKTKIRKGISYNASSEIIVTTGGMEALFLTMRILLNPGEEVLLGAPYFPNYMGQILMCGGVPKVVSLLEEEGFQYNVENLRKAITDKTKVLLINSPSNPTGVVTSEKVLREIAELCIEKDIYLITDEVYQEFVYDEGKYFSIATCGGMKERTIIIDSFSKCYAMTGWRVGYAMGPEKVISNMVKLQESVISSVNTPSQYAALAAIEGSQAIIKKMVAQYGINRKLVVSEINKMPKVSCITPQGAFYVFVNIKQTGMTSEEYAIKLLKEAKVVVVPGSGFGEAGEGYVRLSYVATTENIKEGLRRISKFQLVISN